MGKNKELAAAFKHGKALRKAEKGGCNNASYS